MPVEQAIFTSMVRRGKAGYHLVARSPGLTESEAGALATWSPSHGGLIVDGLNRTSANFFPLPTGRFALSRTRPGRAEYSGRGGRQLYTRAVVVEAEQLRKAGYQPFAVYRDALALGHFLFDPNPPPVLKSVELSALYRPYDADACAGVGRALGPTELDTVLAQLDAGRAVVFSYPGDRAALAEFLIARLAPEAVLATSFATSLRPSSVRPFTLSLVGPG